MAPCGTRLLILRFSLNTEFYSSLSPMQVDCMPSCDVVVDVGAEIVVVVRVIDDAVVGGCACFCCCICY